MPGIKSPVGKRPAKSATKIKISKLRSGGNRKGFTGYRSRSAKANRHTPANG